MLTDVFCRALWLVNSIQISVAPIFSAFIHSADFVLRIASPVCGIAVFSNLLTATPVLRLQYIAVSLGMSWRIRPL